MPIELDPDALKRARDMLEGVKGGAARAITRAINRTLDGAKTKIAAKVTETYAIKARDVKAAFKLTRANYSTLEAQLDITGPRVGLGHFKITPRTDTTGAKRRPVKAEVRKGSPFQVETGFVWQNKVFRREGPSRLPITKLSGPAVAQMAGSEEVLQEVEQDVNEKFSHNVDHEITAILEGWAK